MPLTWDVFDWIALRRVCNGNVAKIGDSTYLDSGTRMPCFVPETIDRLVETGLIALIEKDEWVRVKATDRGMARFVELDRRKRGWQ